MPVQIDEITAEVAPSASESAPAPSSRASESSPETELRRQRALLAQLEVRAARVRAD